MVSIVVDNKGEAEQGLWRLLTKKK